MLKKKNLIFFLIFTSALFSIFFIYVNFFKNKPKITEKTHDHKIYSSNVINNVEYKTKDLDGNEYTIIALKGEIDYSDPNIIYLTNVNSMIKLKNSEKILIKSDYGKYNSENFDTIFSKNVNINYLENTVKSEYLDFSLDKNLMIISKNVIYKNLNNTLEADVVELNIKTKDTKIFMYNEKEKVIISETNYGNN